MGNKELSIHNKPIGTYRWECIENEDSPLNRGTSSTSLPLSLTNGASWTTQNSKTCIDFDGTNDILVTNAAPLISFYDGFSISFWVYLDSTPGSSREFFRLGENTSGTGSPYMYLSWYNSSYMRVYLHNGSYSDSENLSYPPGNNAWTHIVLTFVYTTSSSNYTTVRYYKNGVQQDYGQIRGLRWRGVHEVYFDTIAFGGRPNSNISINGKMRDIQIFESTLSQSQINELYSDVPSTPAIALNSIQIYDISNNRFDPSLNTFPTSRSFGISETLGNKIYTIGGGPISAYGVRQSVNKVEIYDTSNNTWTTGSTLPTARYSMASAITHNRYIYTIGGEGNQNCLERYDTTNDAWESSSTSSAFLVPHLTNIPVNSKNIVAGSDTSHNIYVMGNNSVTVYKHSNIKVASNKPYDLSGIQYDQYSIFSTVKDGSGIFYLIGGAPFGKYLSSYNHETNEWKSLALMNTGREGAGSAVINNKIYTFGGDSDISNNSAEVYDISNNTWSIIEPSGGTFYSRKHPFVGTVNNKAYIIGGGGKPTTLSYTDTIPDPIWTTLDLTDRDSGTTTNATLWKNVQVTPAVARFGITEFTGFTLECMFVRPDDIGETDNSTSGYQGDLVRGPGEDYYIRIQTWSNNRYIYARVGSNYIHAYGSSSTGEDNGNANYWDRYEYLDRQTTSYYSRHFVHVVLVYDYLYNKMRLYVNGLMYEKTNITSMEGQSTNRFEKLTVGAGFQNSTNTTADHYGYFAHHVFTRLWKKPLTDAEINQYKYAPITEATSENLTDLVMNLNYNSSLVESLPSARRNTVQLYDQTSGVLTPTYSTSSSTTINTEYGNIQWCSFKIFIYQDILTPHKYCSL